MFLKPQPPPIPADLLAQFGMPDHAFGPNMRFRVASVLLGTLLMCLGAGLFVIVIVMRNARPGAGGFDGLMMYVIGGLFALGGVAVYYPLSMPINWFFICPNGLIRRLNGEWESAAWAEVARFQDLGLTSGVKTIRQCRIVLNDGTEWGFMADWVTNYGQLARVLGEVVAANRPTNSAGR